MRTDRSFFAYKSQTFQDTEFTDWYRAHRPLHVHQWGQSSCRWSGNIFGLASYSCGDDHPVWSLSPESERAFVEQADAASLDAFFRGIASNDPGEQQKAVQAAMEDIWRGEGT